MRCYVKKFGHKRRRNAVAAGEKQLGGFAAEKNEF
jgi:hypothetical protein